MRRVALILLISVGYIGCAAVRPQEETRQEHPQRFKRGSPAPGGIARVWLPAGPTRSPSRDGPEAESFAHDLGIGRSLLIPGPDGRPQRGVARSWRRDTVADGAIEPGASTARVRWSFRLDGRARFPDGTPVTPWDVIDWWEDRLHTDGSPSRWLLAPVVGVRAFLAGEAEHVAGLVGKESELVLLLNRKTPDLPARLTHPALHVLRSRPGENAVDGPGPFQPDASRGRLTANPHFANARPYLDGVELVEGKDEDPALLLRLDEADLAVVYGRTAGELLDGPDSRISLVRAPGWDRAYALWLNPGSRWVNDPSFRRWLGERIDRAALLRYLLDGRGEPIRSLSSVEGSAADASPLRPVRPHGERSRPRLSVLFDDDDPHAATIAARVRADLKNAGVELTLRPATESEVRSRLAGGRESMALIAHRPSIADPLLGLRETLSPVESDVQDALHAIDEACRLKGRRARLAAAEDAERLLLADGRLIPLVRLHAWLATRSGLAGVEVGPAARLSLESAWWLP